MHLPDRVQAVALWAAIALAGGSEPSRFLWDGPWHGGAAVLRLDNTRVSALNGV